MKAVVFTGPGSVELCEVPEPQVAGGGTLVHVRLAGICGSELHGCDIPASACRRRSWGLSSRASAILVTPW